MITILKTTDQGMREIEELAYGSWVKVVDLSADEIDQPPEWLAFLRSSSPTLSTAASGRAVWPQPDGGPSARPHTWDQGE